MMAGAHHFLEAHDQVTLGAGLHGDVLEGAETLGHLLPAEVLLGEVVRGQPGLEVLADLAATHDVDDPAQMVDGGEKAGHVLWGARESGNC